MVTDESLERLSNYIMATVYMHSKDPQKIATLEKREAKRAKTDLPQAVKDKDDDQIAKILKAIASDLTVSDKKLTGILHGNFLPVLHLMEDARKKIRDDQTLLRYLQVVAQIDGKTLGQIAKGIGRKTPSYFKNVALHDTYKTKRKVLLENAPYFGISIKTMADAVSRSQIRDSKPKKPTPKKRKSADKAPLKVHPTKDFNKRLDMIRSKWFIPRNFMETVNDFIHNLEHRKYKVTKGATNMYVDKIQVDASMLTAMTAPQCVKFALSKVYPEKLPSNMIQDPKKYQSERRDFAQVLANAHSVDDGHLITLIKNRMRIKLDNKKRLTVFIYNFSWPLPETHEISANIGLVAYVHHKQSARVRKLLKKFGNNNGNNPEYI